MDLPIPSEPSDVDEEEWYLERRRIIAELTGMVRSHETETLRQLHSASLRLNDRVSCRGILSDIRERGSLKHK
jgi:hypothetical protein